MVVFIKQVNISNPGTSVKVGADQWDILDKYHGNVDVSGSVTNLPQVATNTTFNNGILRIRNPANTFSYSIASSAIAANRVLTLPLLTADDTLMSLAFAQSPTNKTISVDTNTINHSTTNAAGDVLKSNGTSFQRLARGTANQVLSVNGAGTDLVWATPAGGGNVSTTSSNTYGDFDQIFRSSRVKIRNPADTFSYSIVGSAVAAARNVTLPLLTADDVFATEAFTQTLTNKTINATNNTITDSSTAAGDILKSNGTKFLRLARGSANQVLAVNSGGTDVAWATPAVAAATTAVILLNSGVNTTTASSVTEFDLLNYSLAGNTLGTNGSLRVRLSGYVLQNQATATDYTLKIKFGTTTIYSDVRTALSQQAINRPFVIEFHIGNKNATNSQGCTGIILLQDSDNANVATGEGDAWGDDEEHGTGAFRCTDPAKDTTSAQTLQITMTHSVNSASVATTVTRRTIEFIPGV